MASILKFIKTLFKKPLICDACGNRSRRKTAEQYCGKPRKSNGWICLGTFREQRKVK